MQVKFGLALFATGDYAQAREAALQALSKRPGDEQALSLLADTARSSEEIEDVRKTHRRPSQELTRTVRAIIWRSAR